MHDLAVFDGYDRDEPVVVRVAGADFLPMHLIFEDEDARVLRSVHDEPIPAVQDGAVAVSGVERHQRVTPLNLRRKAREREGQVMALICLILTTIRLRPSVMNGIMTDEDLNFIGPIAPVKLFSGREGRCSAKLLFGNFKFIGTMFRIVF